MVKRSTTPIGMFHNYHNSMYILFKTDLVTSQSVNYPWGAIMARGFHFCTVCAIPRSFGTSHHLGIPNWGN
jgi:hypothetical protein